MDIQPVDFRYTLTIAGVNYVLTNSPDGWEQSLISWKRSDTYFGMIRSFTTPLKFVTKGAFLLRNEFYQFGIEAKADLLIEKLNRSTWQYETLYIGSIDFSRFQDNDDYVEVNVMEGGISQLVKAYENVVYEIDVDVPEAVEVQLPGIPLQQTFTDIIIPIPGFASINRFIAGVNVVLEDLLTNSVQVQDVEQEHFTGISSGPVKPTADRWFVKNISAAPILINMQFSISGYFKNISPRIEIVTSVGVSKLIILNEYIALQSTINKNVQFTLEPGEAVSLQIFYVASVDYAGNFINFFSINEGTITCTFGAPQPPSIIKTLRPKYVFDKLIEKMVGEPATTQSFLLNEWEQLTITSGDAIRGIVGSKIKTSFRDFYNSMNSVLNIGFGFENNKPVLEKKSYFFKSSLLASNIGVVKSFSLDPVDVYFYSSLKIGYTKQDYDELNGRDEFNAGQVYSLPITRVQREMNLLSPYRADCFGIEYTRINLEGKDSTDSSSDNDTFFIYINPGLESGQTYYRPQRKNPDYPTVTGVLSPDDVFNLIISPKQNLKRHGDYIRSVCDGLDGQKIKFQSADRNADLVTVDLNGVRVAENSDLDISTLGNKIFLPYIATITTALPKNTMALLESFPTGFVRFNYRGNNYDGFILEASVDVAKNKEREFKLLLTPNNDLLKLIR